jgi:predicted O-methyltransferase YrrM
MEFISAALSRYVEEHTTKEPEYLYKLNRETHLKVMQPRMLSGHLQGRFLSLISHLMQPQLVLEIGTYTGYSALCLAEGLTPNGKLFTIDINEELAPRVRSYFSASEFSEQIDYKIGAAMELIPTLNEKWDIVFIDADKHNYINYYHLVFPMVNAGVLVW